MLTVLPLSPHPLLIVIDSDKDAAIALGYNILDSPLFGAGCGASGHDAPSTLFFRIWISHTFFTSALFISSTISTIYSFSATSQMN